MQFLENYRGNHLSGASLLELIPQLDLLSTQKFTKCLVSFDMGQTWRYPLENDAIGVATLMDIEEYGVAFDVMREKLLAVLESNLCVAFSIILPGKLQPQPFKFCFKMPIDGEKFLIDATSILKG